MDENLKKEIHSASQKKLAKVNDDEKKKREEEKKKREAELAKVKAAMTAKGIKEDTD